jgi:tRNA-modifying protein YgfZ
VPATHPSLDAQYRALREECGLLDRSDRARLAVSGSEAGEFLQGQLTNDVESLAPGEGCYAALLDRKGKIRADMRVLRVAPDRFLIDTEGPVGVLVRSHLDMYRVGRDAEVDQAPEGESMLSLIGPRARHLLGDAPLGSEHGHREVSIEGATCRVIATDSGADLIVPADDGERVREHLLAAGAEPIEEAAAEIARVEAGRPRLGREITEGTMPQEAGINERAVSFTKGCYIGQETVARLHYKGKPNRHLRVLRPDREVANGDVVLAGEREVGRVGTAVLSPAEGPLALAILRREAAPGERVEVGDEAIPATVEEIGHGEEG